MYRCLLDEVLRGSLLLWLKLLWATNNLFLSFRTSFRLLVLHFSHSFRFYKLPRRGAAEEYKRVKCILGQFWVYSWVGCCRVLDMIWFRWFCAMTKIIDHLTKVGGDLRSRCRLWKGRNGFITGDSHLEMRCCKLSSQEITEIFQRSNSVKSFAQCGIRTADP